MFPHNIWRVIRRPVGQRCESEPGPESGEEGGGVRAVKTRINCFVHCNLCSPHLATDRIFHFLHSSWFNKWQYRGHVGRWWTLHWTLDPVWQHLQCCFNLFRHSAYLHSHFTTNLLLNLHPTMRFKIPQNLYSIQYNIITILTIHILHPCHFRGTILSLDSLVSFAIVSAAPCAGVGLGWNTKEDEQIKVWTWRDVIASNCDWVHESQLEMGLSSILSPESRAQVFLAVELKCS